MKTELQRSTTSISIQNPSLFNTSHSPLAGALNGCLGSLDGACIEKLLLHCASALESNDVTLAQQVMWVLNNVASSNGDPNQRLTSWFLKTLVSRASRLCPTPLSFNASSSSSINNGNGGGITMQRRMMSVTELAGYVDLIPWHRFGFCASNSAILKAIEGYEKVHILDFSITNCMQWPTLIDVLSKRAGGPPKLSITVPSIRPPMPPFVNVSIEDVGLRLSNFAKFKDVPFEFNVIGSTTISSSTSSESSKEFATFEVDKLLSHLNPSMLGIREDEALVINCQNWLRYLYNEPINGEVSYRDTFLSLLKSLNPRVILVVDEDCDLSVSSLTLRITTCFNYLWIPFDALETFLPKSSRQRLEYESDVGHKIENIIGFEGSQRIERLECGMKLCLRMRNLGYFSVPFCDGTMKEVKGLLDEHASGWGMKGEDDMLVLTWKGHNAVFATAWVP